MPGLKLFFFGHPRVKGENSWIEIGLRKSLALLAYLATTKQSQSRESMATMLWPEADQRSALGNLRRAIYRVNNAIQENILVATRNIIEFSRQADVWLDIDEFQTHTRSCLNDDRPQAADCFSQLSQAVELYTNDFLAGFTLPDCRDFDDWQYFQAENLKATLDKSLDWLLTASREANNLEQAIFFARRQLALNPLNDTTHFKIIELYALNNQRAAALLQYDEYRTILKEVLGIPPDETVVALYESIRNKQFPKPAKSQQFEIQSARVNRDHQGSAQKFGQLTRPDHLPVQSRPFIGRNKELAELLYLLVEDANSRLITITGLSGIGKTRLAIEAAIKSVQAFKDGVCFISLASIPSAESIGSEIAGQILGPSYEGAVNQQRLLHHLQDKCMLLILDNFEHLLPAPGILSDILHVAPKVKILVTSNDRLRLEAETVYALQGMAYPGGSSSADLLSYGAVQLLIQNAHLTHPQIKIRPKDYPHIARICRLVLGMPIALIQAAGWIDTLSYSEIADEIAKNIDFLKSQINDLPKRQLSLRAVFDYTWQRLSPAEKGVFMHLSVNHGEFSREAAEQFAGAELHTLRSLIDKSLISTKKTARYEIHGLLRQYGQEQLKMAGEMEATLTAHSNYYLKFLSRQTANLKGRGQRAALAEIEADFENIRAAWHWALQTKHVTGIDQALESLFLFCDTRGRQEVGANLFKDAQKALAPEPGGRSNLVFGRILIRLGMLQSRFLRDCPFVHDTIQKGVEVVQEYKSDPDIAFGLLALAHYAADTQLDGDRALQLFQKSYDLFSEIGDDYYAARAAHLIGHCQLFTTGIENFIPFGEQSLSISRRIGDKANVALLLISLAMVKFFGGDYVTTESYAQEALSIASEVGHIPAWAQSNTFLGILALLKGRLTEANKFIHEGFAIAQEVNFPVPLIYSKAAQAVLACLADQDNPQNVKIDKIHQVDPYAQLFVYWALAIVNSTCKDFQTAKRYVQKIYKIDSQLGAPSIAALTIPMAAIVQASENRFECAVELLALAENHPLSCFGWMEQWSLLGEVRTRLKNKLGAGGYRAAWDRGKKRNTDTVSMHSYT
jgi:predicted ATPase/DNA-binding SARP family transcriptional activator